MKVHVLEQSGPRAFHCVLHALIPAGNNSAGVAWKAAAIGAKVSGPDHIDTGKASVLSIGTGGAGQITQAEYDQLVAGDVIEFDVTLELESGGTTSAQVNALASQAIAERQTDLAAKLKWFGHAQGTVS